MTTTDIHHSAVISQGARLSKGVKVGPFSTIGENVTIGRDTIIDSHVAIEGNTTIGEKNRFYPFSSIGLAPQDVYYKDEDTRLIIGNENIIREFTTINRATVKQDKITRMGDKNYIMAYAHIAHDCVIGNHVVMANAATLAGHIEIGDHAIIGGLVAIHQFVRVGEYAFVGGKSAIPKDVPPFMMVAGDRAKLYGLNIVGLKREGFPRESIDSLKKAYNIIWCGHHLFKDAMDIARKEVSPCKETDILFDFLTNSKRGIIK